MSVIETEVKEALKGFSTSKAIYRVSAGYGGLQFSKSGRPTSENCDFITKMVSTNSQVTEHFNFDTMRHELGDRNLSEITGNIRWEVQRYLLNFVSKYSDSKNNKLTVLYRWFNGAVGAHTMVQHPQLESDLWNIYKWLKTSEAHSRVSSHTQNALKVLEVIRQRYEAKGIKA